MWLLLTPNALCDEDEHFHGRNDCIRGWKRTHQNVCSNFIHTHSYSYQKWTVSLQRSKKYLWTTVSSIELKGLQKVHVDKQNKRQTLSHTTSKLIAAYCACICTYNYCVRSQKSIQARACCGLQTVLRP